MLKKDHTKGTRIDDSLNYINSLCTQYREFIFLPLYLNLSRLLNYNRDNILNVQFIVILSNTLFSRSLLFFFKPNKRHIFMNNFMGDERNFSNNFFLEYLAQYNGCGSRFFRLELNIIHENCVEHFSYQNASLVLPK
jgi:hypothetical protein